MIVSEDDELSRWQGALFRELGRLSSRDLQYTLDNPNKYAVRDEHNPLLSRPTGLPVNGYYTKSAEAYRIMEAYFAAWSAKDDISSLYEMMFLLRLRKDNISKVASRMRAIEYAIWDAKYRFEELLLRFIEVGKDNSVTHTADGAEYKRVALRKRINRFFKANRIKRGKNTHQEAIGIRVESDISQLSWYLTMAPVRREFAEPQVVKFILGDARRRLREHLIHKRKEHQAYDKGMEHALEGACEFVLTSGGFSALVDAALSESREAH